MTTREMIAAANTATKVLFWGIAPHFRSPRDHITTPSPEEFTAWVKRTGELADVLKHGKPGPTYRGSARCRICHVTLGSCDMLGFGFVWPQRAEHYIHKHNVWTPECTELYLAAHPPTVPA